MRVLLTGGAGFIGHHILEHFLINTNWDIVSLDRLDTSGTLNRIADLQSGRHGHHFFKVGSGIPRVNVVHHDLKAALNSHVRNRIGKVDIILHLAGATHVDRSILDPMSFVQDNVVGTCNLLEYARSMDGLTAFVYFSTDEVFGPAPKNLCYEEWARYHSGNPYAASKAGAEELSLAYHNTYGLPVIITHTMNVFGERQAAEKFIPMSINRILRGEEILIHADRLLMQPGSRFYIHARNVAAALLFLLDPQASVGVGDKYNIVGEREVTNLELVKRIAAVMDKPLSYRLVDFHSSRPGHDLRYALDGERMTGLGWRLPVSFDDSLEKTIRWTLEHGEWLQ